MLRSLTVVFFLLTCQWVTAQLPGRLVLSEVDTGWAANSINTVIFRKNSLSSFRDTQFIAFYDAGGMVVLGKRKLGSRRWYLQRTEFHGRVTDAHNSISLMADGRGYLHMAWDHHNNPLNYARSVRPGSLQLKRIPAMSGQQEKRVSYPEFYRLPSGDLLFLFREGESGKGNLVVERYRAASQVWQMQQTVLLDGQGERSAYWQACVDPQGRIHLSWVWRETADVASNHDLCYARSPDGGKTWQKSSGAPYTLPITAANAEYISRIPQGSDLINQTSISTDQSGNPCIASYWRNQSSAVPQYRVLYFRNGQWHLQNLNFRKSDFSLKGMGTRKIPISRPQILVRRYGSKTFAGLLFRDTERGDRISIATTANLAPGSAWKVSNLSSFSVGDWEPSYDTDVWKQYGLLSLFVQYVQQKSAEELSGLKPQPVRVLDWYPAFNEF